MRWCALTVLVVVSGCARWTGVSRARQVVLREGLMEQRMPSGFRLALAPTVAGLDCRVGAESIERCVAGVQNVWFGVTDGPEGGQFVVPESATEQQIVNFWKAIDLANFREFEPQVEARVNEVLAREEAEFEPRWGLTAAFTSGLSSTVATGELGAKAGVRRWFTINWGGFVALDYGLRLATAEHRLSARLGVELTRFTPGRLWGRVGAPPASISAFIGPRLAIPGPVPGVRTGVGLLLTDWKMAPVTVEFCADTWFTGESSRVEFFLAVGFGL